MRKITAAQNKKMHALAKELGMDSGLLHEFVEMLTGKKHISGLSITEAAKAIDSLEGKLNYNAGSHATKRQMDYILSLMKLAGWQDAAGQADIKRLDGLVKKQYGIDSHRFMDKKTASNVIESLKQMGKRENAKGAAGNA